MDWARTRLTKRQNSTVSVWLYEQLSIRIEGKIRVRVPLPATPQPRSPERNTDGVQGFDEFMNLVIDDAVEVKQITKTNDKESRRQLGMMVPSSSSIGRVRTDFCAGQILLKGDNVSLIQSLS